MFVREYTEKDIPEMTKIWNEVVRSGNAFPQQEELTENEAEKFFSEQSFTGVAQDTVGNIYGLYILHPNNVGRCGHLANASYAVKNSERGKHIGEELVKHSLTKGKALGFRVLQFNAVVKTNIAALKLYEHLKFAKLGTIPGGFLMNDGTYEDIVLLYHEL